MIKINEVNAINSVDKLSEEINPPGEKDPVPEDLLFADQVQSKALKLTSDSLNRLRKMNHPTEILKARLRNQISKELIQGLMVPEIVEGLVEFLADLLPEDPQQAQKFDLFDS